MFLDTPFKSENHQESTNKLAVVNTKHADQGVNLIVRAVIILDGHILLSRPTATNKGFSQNQYFLPGGHVDYTESAISALNRELKEEMSINGKITDFIGALECSWQRKDSIYHEINLIYCVAIDGLSLNNPPKSTEHNLEFIWCQLEELPNLTILPTKLASMIQTYCFSATQAQFCSEML